MSMSVNSSALVRPDHYESIRTMPEKVLRGNIATFRAIFHGAKARKPEAVVKADVCIRSWQRELQRRGVPVEPNTQAQGLRPQGEDHA